MTKDCYQRAMTDLQVRLEDSALGDFWIWDFLLWKLLIAAIVLPPVILYATALIGKWVWKGFNAPKRMLDENTGLATEGSASSPSSVTPSRDVSNEDRVTELYRAWQQGGKEELREAYQPEEDEK